MGGAASVAVSRARGRRAVSGAIVRDRVVWAVGTATVAGAALRFATLDWRGYWVDEAATVDWLREGFREMLSLVVSAESSPPLYFALAWVWARAFGTGEVALRSLSALAGTLTIVIVYAIGARLVSRRVGLAAAVLAAVSPLLVWHAQDARPHALLILLSGTSFLLFLRAVDGGQRALLAWAAISVMAVATHWFAAFLVAVEAIWLLRVARPRRGTLGALAIVSLGVAALLPIAIAQQANSSASWIAGQPIGSRLVQVPAQFLVGYQPPLQRTSAGLAGLLAVAAVVLLLKRAGLRERRRVVLSAAIGLSAGCLAVLLALAGLDGLLTRNLTPVWVPLAVAVAAGFRLERAGRVGLAALAALTGVSLAIVIASAGEPKFEREDWRGAADAVGPPRTRAIVLEPENGILPFRHYRPSSRQLRGGVRVTEIVIIALGPEHRQIGRRPEPPRPVAVAPPAPGFRLVERIDARSFTLVRFRAARPVLVAPSVARHRLGDAQAAVLVES